MSQMRKDPFTDTWVIFAQARHGRPREFSCITKKQSTRLCPFCPGNEKETTQTIWQNHPDHTWNIRVFENLYPIVDQSPEITEKESFYAQKCGKGHHEVIVDTPDHNGRIEKFTVEHLAELFSVLAQRMRNIAKSPESAYIQVFKNNGPMAGMSLVHSHWQLISLPVIPERISHLAEKAEGNCLFCEMLAYEQDKKIRMIQENENFAALCPYASSFPYETAFYSKRHVPSFIDFSEKELRDLAALMLPILQKTAELSKDGCSYNICFFEQPKGRDFHWHAAIYPRLNGIAGLECATGTMVNYILPEEAAEYFRK